MRTPTPLNAACVEMGGGFLSCVCVLVKDSQMSQSTPRNTMKKIALLAALAAVSAAASAQSSVTMFGVLDAAVRNVKNGDQSITSVGSGGLATSRFGFRGVEDLGGGLQAGFWLESGVNVDDGTSSDTTKLFNRRSTVSLSSGLGEIRLGRDFSPTYNGYTTFEPFGSNGVASADKFQNKLTTNADFLTRSDNQVSYFTPNGLGGFYGQLAVGAGEGIGGKKHVSGRVGYLDGPINVSVAYGEATVTPIAGEDKYKTLDVGGSYDFGMAKVMGYYTQSKFGDRKLNVYNIGGAVPVGVGVIRLGYIKADASGAGTDGNDASQIALGYVHNLSKRTALYATAARVNNKGSAAYAVNASPVLAAGRDSTGYEIGMRHSF
ncbi:MAG: Porin [Rhizobacter sp.]|nr:Porin [Rhizobacter sp.]